MLKHLPNILTASRIVLIPLVLIAYMLLGREGQMISACLFLLACITDFFDGYLARIYAAQSRFGMFLDPIADKLLVGSVMMMLVYYRQADLLPSIAIICREILVSGLREFLAGIRVSMPVSSLSKVKTGFQMAAIFMLLIGDSMSCFAYMEFLGRSSLWIAAGLTIFTGYAYLKAGLKHISVTGED